MNKYSFKKGAGKAAIIPAIGAALAGIVKNTFPEIAGYVSDEILIGGCISILGYAKNYLKYKVGINLPF